MSDKLFKVDMENSGLRLDKFLAEENSELSRSYIKKLIEEDHVSVNEDYQKSSYKIRKGDLIKLSIPEAKTPEIEPVKMNLDILYEDKSIIVVNKPPGLVVHPVPGNWNDTLVNGLLEYTDDLSGINGVKRPGIVHRLDKDTSGALVVAKNDQSHKFLVEQFKKRETKKIYHTIVKGIIPHEEGVIDAPIGRNPADRKKMAVTKENSKKAVSHFKVKERFENFTYLDVKLETGRTHQIRVHLSYMGFPILGDSKYGKIRKLKNGERVNRQLLHAHILGFNHPLTEEFKEFQAPLPDDFIHVLEYLRNTK
ncbi:MAG: RluA family pseudouridine synthase [Halanaerobiaceae bacterium]